MSAHFSFRFLILAFGLLLSCITHTAFGKSSTEPDLEKVVLSLLNKPQFTFTMPTSSNVNFFLLVSKNDGLLGRITISDQGCTLGHQVSIAYQKTKNEILTTYFPKEIPWGSTYKLGVIRDLKTETITITLNEHMLTITPYKKAKFIYLTKNPENITLINIEQD